MPLPIEIRQALSEGKPRRGPEDPKDLFNKVPTLSPYDFPDSVTLWDLISNTEHYDRLKVVLIDAGFTKGQRGGLSNTLGSMARIREHEVTVGDIRELTLDQLILLQQSSQIGQVTENALRRVKKLCGSHEVRPEIDLRERIIF